MILNLSKKATTSGRSTSFPPSLRDYLLRFRMSLQGQATYGINNPTIVAGPARNDYNAITFNGVDQYMNRDGNTSFMAGIQGLFSVSFWIKPVTGSNSIQRIILSYGTSGAGGTGFQFLINSGATVVRYVSNAGFNAGVSFTFDAWNHIVLTVNGTSRKMYVNNNAPTSNTNASNTFSGTQFKVASNTAGNSAFFYGGVDDIIIWNRELSAADVALLYGYV